MGLHCVQALSARAAYSGGMHRSRRSGPSEGSLTMLVFAVFGLGVVLAAVYHSALTEALTSALAPA